MVFIYKKFFFIINEFLKEFCLAKVTSILALPILGAIPPKSKWGPNQGPHSAFWLCQNTTALQ
jgi:hypothetical protein